jgi:hypothetical protein
MQNEVLEVPVKQSNKNLTVVLAIIGIILVVGMISAYFLYNYFKEQPSHAVNGTEQESPTPENAAPHAEEEQETETTETSEESQESSGSAGSGGSGGSGGGDGDGDDGDDGDTPIPTSSKIIVNSPGSLWTESRDVEFNITFNETLDSYGFVDFEDSLVGWWRGEGGLDDESGNNHHFNFYGDNIYTNGRFGSAFSFDGSDANHIISDMDLLFNEENHTFSLWMNPRFDLTQGIFMADNLEVFIHGVYTNTSNVIYFNMHGGMFESSEPAYAYFHDYLTLDSWNHVVLVMEHSLNFVNISLYVNGNYMESDVFVRNITSAHRGDFHISRVIYGPGYPAFNGSLDEIMVFKRALDSDEIKGLYNVTSKDLLFTLDDVEELKRVDYKIYSVNNNSEKSNLTSSFMIDVPDSTPLVSLDAPLTPTRSNNSTQQFKCSAKDTNEDTTLSNITLYYSYGESYSPDETIQLSGNSDSATFTKEGLNEGTIKWNCYACDSRGNCQFSSTDNQLVIGQSEYYVSLSGNDSNQGIINHPFRTVQKCADIAMAGDSCIIREGIYRETVTPARSGNSLAPITFISYPGEKVIISGAEIINTSWIQHNGSVYKTDFSPDLSRGKNQIFVNGTAMFEARWPNTKDISVPVLLYASGYGGGISGSTLTVRDGDLTQPDNCWKGCIYHGIWGQRYHAATADITSSSQENQTITGILHTNTRGNPNDYNQYYLVGCYNALDNETEWHYDNETKELYFWAPESVDPNTLEVEAKARQQAFNFNHKSYIIIKDLDIFASNIITDKFSSGIVIDNIDAKYVTHFTLIDEGDMGEGQMGVRDTGIVLDGNNHLIKNSEIAYSSCNGISMIGSNSEVRNCSIHDVNYAVTECAAISTGFVEALGIDTENNRIIGNELYNTGRSIINHAQSRNLSILYNEMYHNRWGGMPWDLGATYTINSDGMGTEIAYNYIHDIRSIGIYLDNANWNFNIHHNVVDPISEYTGRDVSLHMNTPSVNHTITHNTFKGYLTKNHIGGGEDTAESTEIKNNIYYSASDITTIGATMENNIKTYDTDPYTIFADYDNNNFHLKENSPAIDAGQDLGYTHDFQGNPIVGQPDIGAYEYQGIGATTELPAKKPSFSTIWSWLKGFLTGNTIREITGNFLKIN